MQWDASEQSTPLHRGTVDGDVRAVAGRARKRHARSWGCVAHSPSSLELEQATSSYSSSLTTPSTPR